MTDRTNTVKAPTRVLFTPLPDGGVLLDLETKVYFTLNPTGAELWAQLARGPTDRNRLAEYLGDEFDVDQDTARSDVDGWLEELIDEGLIEVIP